MGDFKLDFFWITYKWWVRTSQETHYVSAIETNCWCCFRKQSLFTVRTIRNTNTFCGQN
jgi:hypothetical protein